VADLIKKAFLVGQVPTIQVAISGVKSTRECAAAMGEYGRLPSLMIEGRPVYKQQAGDCYMWYQQDRKKWYIGPEKDVGRMSCFMFVIDALSSPGHINPDSWMFWGGTIWEAAAGVTQYRTRNQLFHR
jgi:hypothetical protein